MNIDEIIQLIPVDSVDGLTVSGGEPFEQPDELAGLLYDAMTLGLHRLVYSGFTYEELIASNNKSIWNSLLLTDTLIDGPYQQSNPTRSPLTGSGNQRILNLKNGVIIENEFPFSFMPQNTKEIGEIHINEYGTVTVTGVFDSNFLTQELQ
jgi:anaerobic ribonucleoside-triphosphate reductase activating protein